MSVSWCDLSQARCRKLLASVQPGVDRVALLRTLAWLQGGRVDLRLEGVRATDVELALFDRFSLKLVSEAGVVRLIDEAVPDWWPPALVVDPSDRRATAAGSADAVLEKLTGKSSYRSYGQKAAVRAMLTQPAGAGLMVSLPTGAGKSLLFQLAALRGRLAAPGSCVVVITPTIALAVDHERSLSTMPGLEGSRALTGDQPAGQAKEVLDAFRRGEVPVLLLGPEAALRPDTADRLVEAASADSAAFGLEARLTHLFVDEAHIVESWGRNFRPDFQRLPGLLSRLRAISPATRLVLLSATLPVGARAILRKSWSQDGPWLEVDAKVPRYEHDVMVQSFSSADARRVALEWVVDRVPRPAIVYTTEVEHAKDIHRLIREKGYDRAALFTGETAASQRRTIIEGWARDDLDIVVATSAFGMGVDKADVRSVVHACLPEGVARWYQEIGRAARDGGQGLAVLLFTDSPDQDDDVDRARGIATGGWLTRDLAEKRWVAMIEGATAKTWADGYFVMSVDLDAIREGLRPWSSDYNRNWNRALLTLLQRAGVLEVLSSQDDAVGKNLWKIRLLDAHLLESSPACWDSVFATRTAEQGAARAEFNPFAKIVRESTQACVTRGAFELIEPSSYAPPCGRCPGCRADGIQPPKRLPSGGLEAVWAEAPEYVGPLPSGKLIVLPEDPSFERRLPSLLEALVRVGIAQFIVSDDMADVVRGALCFLASDPGFVLTFDEWAADGTPAFLPTALLLPEAETAALEIATRYAEWGRERTYPVVLIAEGARLIGERRLDQWFSRQAPIKENRLVGSGLMQGVET